MQPASAPPKVSDRLITAAMQILATDGPSGLKARSIAARVGLTQTAVYNHFGGLPELISAVVEAGFSGLAQRLALATGSRDPASDLFFMAILCRELAQQSPHLYDLMFGLSARGTYRTQGTQADQLSGLSQSFHSAYGHVLEACARLICEQRIRLDDPDIIASKLWSMIHGFSTLELGAHFAHIDDPVAKVLQPMAIDLLVGLGDERTLATASSQKALGRMSNLSPASKQ